MGLRGELWMPVEVCRRELQGCLVVRQRHARREVHLYAVMDVLLFDQAAAGCCCRA